MEIVVGRKASTLGILSYRLHL